MLHLLRVLGGEAEVLLPLKKRENSPALGASSWTVGAAVGTSVCVGCGTGCVGLGEGLSDSAGCGSGGVGCVGDWAVGK